MCTLVSALDWGLGHTTRIIPVIKALLDKGEEVIIGVSKRQAQIYQEFFPQVELIPMPSFSPQYARKGLGVLNIISFLPAFLFSVFREHKRLKHLVETKNITKIVSDNRYGLYNKNAHCIFIGHQLNPIIPDSLRFLKNFIVRIQTRAINRFDECNIPDWEGEESLAGILSNPPEGLKIQTRFLGVLSRLTLVNEDDDIRAPKLLIIISGPEKQRTKFEELILKALEDYPGTIDYFIVRGLPGKQINELPNSINHCTASKLKSLIKGAKYIISRAGYSSIMDLAIMKRQACLVPTPGQTEQEYLASYLQKNNKFVAEKQDNINIQKVLDRLDLLQK